jgi:heme A synthase
MTSHLGVMIFFAACVAAVFAALLRDAPAAQTRYGARVFAALVVGAYALGWLMYAAFA